MTTLSILSSAAYADTNMVFTGNLIVPLCTINNNNQITIPFGDIEIQTLTQANTPYQFQDITNPSLYFEVCSTPRAALSTAVLLTFNMGAPSA